MSDSINKKLYSTTHTSFSTCTTTGMLPFAALPYTLSLSLLSLKICRNIEIAAEIDVIMSVPIMFQRVRDSNSNLTYPSKLAQSENATQLHLERSRHPKTTCFALSS